MSADEFKTARAEYNRDKLKPEEWVNFYNSLQKHKDTKLGVVGGEPTAYEGFYEVVNGIKGYYKTITSNLKSPMIDDLGRFVNSIEDKAHFRLNTSFHPKLISVDEFCNKIHILRNNGINVDQIAMVDHPANNFKYYYHEFIKRGITLTPQTFLGKIDGVLIPDPELNISPDYREHGITNQDLYKQGFSCNSKNKILCMTRRFLVSPNGGFYQCHYHLYSNRDVLGNVRDELLPGHHDYKVCDDFGYCNPCDFPHAKFKSEAVVFEDVLMQLFDGNVEAVQMMTSYYNEYKDRLHDFVIELLNELYTSDSPLWELYNNPKIAEVINGFIEAGGEVDNSNALVLAQLDTVFGVNIYRLFTVFTLSKYLDALGFITQAKIVNGGFEYIEERLKDPKLVKCLDVAIASIFATYTITPLLPGKIRLVKTRQHREDTEE